MLEQPLPQHKSVPVREPLNMSSELTIYAGQFGLAIASPVSGYVTR